MGVGEPKETKAMIDIFNLPVLLVDDKKDKEIDEYFANRKQKLKVLATVKKELFNHMMVIAKIRSVAVGETQVDTTDYLQWIVKFIDSEI